MCLIAAYVACVWIEITGRVVCGPTSYAAIHVHISMHLYMHLYIPYAVLIIWDMPYVFWIVYNFVQEL